MKKLISVLLIGAICGCTTLYTSIVTVTELRKDILNEYGELYRAGLISPDIDYKASLADAAFIDAAAAMEVVLVAYKNGTATDADVQQKFAVVKAALAEILLLIEPLVVKSTADNYHKQLATATKL